MERTVRQLLQAKQELRDCIQQDVIHRLHIFQEQFPDVNVSVRVTPLTVDSNIANEEPLVFSHQVDILIK